MSSFETMTAEEFRRSGLAVRGKRLSAKPTYTRTRVYSKKSDKPKFTRAGGIVNVIVTADDAVG